MSTRTLGVVVAALAVLIGAGGALYFFFAVLPKRQAAERAYADHLEHGRDFLELKGDGSQALVDFKEAAKLFPDRLPPKMLMGRAYLKLQRYAEAIEMLDAAEAVNPNEDDAARISLDRGQCYTARFLETQNRRDMVEAKLNLEKAAGHDPTRAEALFNLGALHAARKTAEDIDKALAYWSDAFKLDRESETAKRCQGPYDFFMQRKNQPPATAPGDER